MVSRPEDRSSNVLYSRGGWKLSIIPKIDDYDEMLFVLKLPLDIGSVYFQRVKKVDESGKFVGSVESVWKFRREGSAKVGTVLKSHILPRRLKQLLLQVDSYMTDRDSIDKSLVEWLD